MWKEIALRIVLLLLFMMTEMMTPFYRVIHKEELWLYQNPRTASYVPSYYMWILITTFPLCVILMINARKLDRVDIAQSMLACTLAFGINGIITNCIKLSYGRPRPDFYYRCFPPTIVRDGTSDGAATSALHYDHPFQGDVLHPKQCTGKLTDIIEGLKSFPSGHSSFSFTSLTFTSLYLAGKLGTFTRRHARSSSSLRLLLVLMPLLVAALVAVSRTADYHHHWQDVSVGSVLGVCCAYLCYRQHYPSVRNPRSHLTLLQCAECANTSRHPSDPTHPVVVSTTAHTSPHHVSISQIKIV